MRNFSRASQNTSKSARTTSKLINSQREFEVRASKLINYFADSRREVARGREILIPIEVRGSRYRGKGGAGRVGYTET